jgi:Xaa-Pro aminopeptidase
MEAVMAESDSSTLATIDHRPRLSRLQGLLGDGALLLLSQPEAYRNSDVHHPYRQNSLMVYLTGFREPECALVVLGKPKEGKSVFAFVRPKDEVLELWEGKRLGVEQAQNMLPVDDAFEISSLWAKVPDLLSACDRVYYDLGIGVDQDRQFVDALKRHGSYTKKKSAVRIPVFDPAELAGQLRIVKQPEEIDRLKMAARITAKAFQGIFDVVRPGLTEKKIHGMLVAEFLAHGADSEAYESIVAGGTNACVLHYRDNDKMLYDGDLLLVDAGAQFDYYAADVTRTFPVGGKFTGIQREVYCHVLAAQAKAIAECRVGNNLEAIHDKAVDSIIDSLIELKLFKESKAEIKEKNLYKKFFPHGTGHWLGMDVHDSGAYRSGGQPVKLQEGMVFTVEPGLYFNPDDEGIASALRGIGVRIEDDILIVKNGCEVLTADIPKAIDQLENRL